MSKVIGQYEEEEEEVIQGFKDPTNFSQINPYIQLSQAALAVSPTNMKQWVVAPLDLQYEESMNLKQWQFEAMASGTTNPPVRREHELYIIGLPSETKKKTINELRSEIGELELQVKKLSNEKKNLQKKVTKLNRNSVLSRFKSPNIKKYIESMEIEE